ncbi:hypothetical protein BU17DRAFT_72465 [Hysterangium stoloniferum]|nr:hypothetical protein BU17DRAFT_72465 [Hysterangium stoloniferum]
MYTAAAADSESDANTFNSKSESAPAPNHQVDTSSGSNMNVSIAFNTSNNNVPFNTVLISPPFGGEGALGSGGGDFMFAAAAKAARSWSNGLSCTRLAPFLGCFVGVHRCQLRIGIQQSSHPNSNSNPAPDIFTPMPLAAWTGEAAQIQPQSQSPLYRHNCSLNASRNTNCTLNLNLNPTSNDNGNIHHITLRQYSLPNLCSRNSTCSPNPNFSFDPDRSFCFLFPGFNRPKLLLRNTLRRRSRVKRGNMVKVNIIIINPQALPVSGVLRLLHHQGRVQGEWAHVQTQFQTWTQGQAQVHSKKQF